MEPNTAADEIMIFFKTLANADRIKIAGLVAIERLAPAQIAERAGLKLADVLRHLDRLVEAGIAIEIPTGSAKETPHPASQSSLYSLDAQKLNELSRRVLSGSRPKVQLDEFEGEDFDRKVLSDFLRPDGTLKSIPTQHKKLLAVLRYLAQEFEFGQRYDEKHVNVLLAKHYKDAASLRRYLVDNRLLARDHGIYWREPIDS